MYKKKISEDGIVRSDTVEALICKNELRKMLAPVLKNVLNDTPFIDSNLKSAYTFSLCKLTKENIYSIKINKDNDPVLEYEKVSARLLEETGFTEKARQKTETLIKKLLSLDNRLMLAFWGIEIKFFFYNNKPEILLIKMNVFAR